MGVSCRLCVEIWGQILAALMSNLTKHTPQKNQVHFSDSFYICVLAKIIWIINTLKSRNWPSWFGPQAPPSGNSGLPYVSASLYWVRSQTRRKGWSKWNQKIRHPQSLIFKRVTRLKRGFSVYLFPDLPDLCILLLQQILGLFQLINSLTCVLMISWWLMDL